MTEPAFKVQQIDHIVLRVRDVERSIRFYGEVLGCLVVKRRDDLGLVHLRAGASIPFRSVTVRSILDERQPS